MTRLPYIAYFTVTALATCGLAAAQDTQYNSSPQTDQRSTVQNNSTNSNNSGNRGWRRVDEQAQADSPAQPDQNPNGPTDAPPPPPAQSPRYSGQPAPPPPNYGTYQNAPAYPQGNYPPSGYPQGNYPQGNYPQGNYPPANAPAPVQHPPVPASLTITRGTYITVRVNQVLSSDHNHAGDAFAATLVRPVVVNGVVVAERGQTIGGRIVEAKKAGMVEGTSKLGIQLTDLTLADGQNIPISSQLISRDGPTSVGRDVGAVAGTTAVGAAAGAAADWGRGAAIGAGAGAAVGILGVLLTRGQPTIIHPEQVLTFRLEGPITVSTDRAPQAFRYVEPGDYQTPELQRRGPPSMGVAGPPAPYYYGRPYYYPGYYPYYYGPSIGFYYGPRYYYRGWRR